MRWSANGLPLESPIFVDRCSPTFRDTRDEGSSISHNESVAEVRIAVEALVETVRLRFARMPSVRCIS